MMLSVFNMFQLTHQCETNKCQHMHYQSLNVKKPLFVYYKYKPYQFKRKLMKIFTKYK